MICEIRGAIIAALERKIIDDERIKWKAMFLFATRQNSGNYIYREKDFCRFLFALKYFARICGFLTNLFFHEKKNKEE